MKREILYTHSNTKPTQQVIFIYYVCVYYVTIIIREKEVNNLKRSEGEHKRGLKEGAWEGLEGEKRRGKGCNYILINI